MHRLNLEDKPASLRNTYFSFFLARSIRDGLALEEARPIYSPSFVHESAHFPHVKKLMCWFIPSPSLSPSTAPILRNSGARAIVSTASAVAEPASLSYSSWCVSVSRSATADDTTSNLRRRAVRAMASTPSEIASIKSPTAERPTSHHR